MNRLNLWKAWCVGIFLGEVAQIAGKAIDTNLVEGLSAVLEQSLGSSLLSIVWDTENSVLMVLLRRQEQAMWLMQSWDAVVNAFEIYCLTSK